MFLHLLVNKFYCLGRNIATIVIEAFELAKEGKQSIANSTTEFVVVAYFACELMVLFEVCYFWHLSLEVGPVSEEIALVELVELIPHLLTALRHLLIILL